MKYDDLIAKAGTEERLACLFGFHTYTIQRWRKIGIPNKYWEILIKKFNLTPAELHSLNENVRKDRRAKANR